jgi:hypothetical protein
MKELTWKDVAVRIAVLLMIGTVVRFIISKRAASEIPFESATDKMAKPFSKTG